jgi:hypothetical protein
VLDAREREAVEDFQLLMAQVRRLKHKRRRE